MAEGRFPTSLKTAIVKPLLKKKSLDPELLKNFRPVSNLPFLSKLVEQIVVSRLLEHITTNDLHAPMQSGYKQYHRTEVALVKVYSDILQAMDKKQGIALLLLDLSAAFDTIDHGILLRRLHDLYKITGAANGFLPTSKIGHSVSR